MKKKKLTEPEDLGIKIGTKEEAAWKQIKDTTDEDTLRAQRLIKINEVILKLADEMIALEQEKMRLNAKTYDNPKK